MTHASARPRRARNLAFGLAALIGLAIIVAGVPLLLLKVMPLLNLPVSGWPSLADLRRALTQRDNGELAAAVIVLIAWVCWALFTVSLIPEVLAALRRKPSIALPGVSAFQRPAGALVALVALGFGIAPIGALGDAHATPPPPLPAAASAHAATSPLGPRLATADVQASEPTPFAKLSTSASPIGAPTDDSDLPTYVVKRHDTLWAIAEANLGDPLRFLEIVALNSAVIGPDNEIYTGTTLKLPADASGLPAANVRSVEVTVEQGDTLSGLVEEHTGRQDWQAAWTANAGRDEPEDGEFTDPDPSAPAGS